MAESQSFNFGMSKWSIFAGSKKTRFGINAVFFACTDKRGQFQRKGYFTLVRYIPRLFITVNPAHTRFSQFRQLCDDFVPVASVFLWHSQCVWKLIVLSTNLFCGCKEGGSADIRRLLPQSGGGASLQGQTGRRDIADTPVRLNFQASSTQVSDPDVHLHVSVSRGLRKWWFLCNWSHNCRYKDIHFSSKSYLLWRWD